MHRGAGLTRPKPSRCGDGPPTAPRRIPGLDLLPAAALGLLVLLVFGSTLAGDFVYDDRFIIVGNPWIRDPGDWDLFFTQDSWAGAGERNWNYRPLPLVTFGLTLWQ